MIAEETIEAFFAAAVRKHQFEKTVDKILGQLDKDEPVFYEVYVQSLAAALGVKTMAHVMRGIAVYHHLLKTQEEITNLGGK